MQQQRKRGPGPARWDSSLEDEAAGRGEGSVGSGSTQATSWLSAPGNVAFDGLVGASFAEQDPVAPGYQQSLLFPNAPVLDDSSLNLHHHHHHHRGDLVGLSEGGAAPGGLHPGYQVPYNTHPSYMTADPRSRMGFEAQSQPDSFRPSSHGEFATGQAQIHPPGQFSQAQQRHSPPSSSQPAPIPAQMNDPAATGSQMSDQAVKEEPSSQPYEALSGPGSSSNPSGRPIRRRMRMITSCLECRRRKLKCDKREPHCTNCLKFARDCRYISPKLDEAGQLRLAEIKEKVGSLERQLERDVVQSHVQATRQQRFLAKDIENEFEEARDLEPTDFVAPDITYDEGDEEFDDVVDLGVLVGKMRLTERIGGLPRTRMSEEISKGISGQPQVPPLQPPNPSPLSGDSPESLPDFLRPRDSYIPPSSGFFMSQSGVEPPLEQLLPTRGAADRLMRQYFDAVHPIARCVHRPSLEAEYQSFWDAVYENVEPKPSLQAVVFAAMFSGAVSMNEKTSQQEFGRSYKALYEPLKLGTEAALSRANFLRTTRVQTLQAFIMYMIPLCRDEVSRAHSVLVGAAVRMAECMGLHRDGSFFGLNPLETHVRRLIWHQICFLDIRTCEAQGPKPAIRRDEYDTKLPLHCDENDITPTSEPSAPANHYTSSLVTLIRFEINEMMRILWIDRRKLETKQISLTSVLTKIESFRRLMFDKYDVFLDNHVPAHRYAKLVMNILLYRLHTMTLHAFQHNANVPLPPRLSSVLITSGIIYLEIGIQLDTNPAFAAWSWYNGAYHQYQIALLLASEIYFKPEIKEAPRVWACLDYVFNTDRSLPTEAKGLQILGEVMNKLAAYQSLRRSRNPLQTAMATPSRNAAAGKGEAGGKWPEHLVRSSQQQQQLQASQSFKPSPAMAPPSSASWTSAPPIVSPDDPSQGAVFGDVSGAQAPWTGLSSVPQVTTVPGMPQESMAPGFDIDWDVMNDLFTSDPLTGNMAVSGYSDPALVMNWQQ